MLLLHKHSFRVARFHHEINSEHSSQVLSQGLVLPVDVIFQDWLDGRALQADAFLDPGADHSMISLRWIHEQADSADTDIREPMMDPSGFLLEKMKLDIGGQRLAFGDEIRRVWIGRQEGYGDEALQELPGLEDMLLGRDFITQHGLLVLIDGDQNQVSLVAPIDPENRRRRDRIVEVLDGDEP